MRSWLFLAVALSLTGCIPVEGPPPAIPATPAERIPPPPASAITLIWEPGHYDWNGTGFDWVMGHWVPKSGHGPLWQDGSWRRTNGSWEWVPAHWL